MFDFVEKRVLVTGASGGIGSEIAAGLHGQGAKVILSGTRQDVLHSLAEKLGQDVHVVACDLSNSERIQQLVKECNNILGGVDILVNNAGVNRDSLVMRMKDADWDTVLNINLTASFQLSKACLRGMMKQRFGRIISVTSIVGVTGNAGQANYAASKSGLIGMSKSLAQEVASRGITVNCVAPGFIVTPMTDALTDEQRGKLLGVIPTGRLGHAKDVAASVVFLASDEASYVTGQTLHVNGGMAMI
ncbi:MAG TPA: 3-oxoacyl-[acyl-carrier-protein] reductase [Rhodospirillales bacterium]|jgi:3-oxoacyl-[acyl-carrier protein] reductase|nr:3-oxoacyl-[acyl-carrier-protein] reductase [Rhodospirillales bacterium]HIL74407.1 3-oxoacyl-[acyl-carrier-protein] reductase [Rhodospirillales bacterium]